MFVDSHAHLDDARFADDLEPVLERARLADVGRIVTVGAGVDSSEQALALARRYPDFVFAAVGVHPHDARLLDDAARQRLRELATTGGAVAVGETGLDYHYDNSPPEAQARAFRFHIELALEMKLPLVVHCREAFDDCLEILRSYKDAGLRGVAHCFSGGASEAKAFLDFGLMLAFGGALTFKNANALRTVAACVPLERTLIETDCPYLSPQKRRGKRNEPAFVVETATALAALHGVTTEAIATATSANAKLLFALGD